MQVFDQIETSGHRLRRKERLAEEDDRQAASSGSLVDRRNLNNVVYMKRATPFGHPTQKTGMRLWKVFNGSGEFYFNFGMIGK